MQAARCSLLEMLESLVCGTGPECMRCCLCVCNGVAGPLAQSVERWLTKGSWPATAAAKAASGMRTCIPSRAHRADGNRSTWNNERTFFPNHLRCIFTALPRLSAPEIGSAPLCRSARTLPSSSPRAVHLRLEPLSCRDTAANSSNVTCRPREHAPPSALHALRAQTGARLSQPRRVCAGI
eukprot:COSAG03_NODE_578_length_6879_cov_5.096018_4_plen_181_part_00